eukprot:760937-Hanusia_phi.AAC.1
MMHTHVMTVDVCDRGTERRYAFLGGACGLAIFLCLCAASFLSPQPESFHAEFHALHSPSAPPELAGSGQDKISCCERFPFLSMDIELAYDTILHRAPDLRGKNWWCEQIVKGRESVPSMRMKFYRTEWRSEAERSARHLLKDLMGKDATWGEIVKLADKIRKGRVTGRMAEYFKRFKELHAVDIDMRELKSMKAIDNFPYMDIILRESMKMILAGEANVMLLGEIFSPGSELWFQAASSLDQHFRACFNRLPIIEVDSSETEAQNNKLLLVPPSPALALVFVCPQCTVEAADFFCLFVPSQFRFNPFCIPRPPSFHSPKMMLRFISFHAAARLPPLPYDEVDDVLCSGDTETAFVHYKNRMVKHAIALRDVLARKRSNFCLCSLRYIQERCEVFVDFVKRLVLRSKEFEDVEAKWGGEEEHSRGGAEDEEERRRVRAAVSDLRSMDGESLEEARAQVVTTFESYLHRKPSDKVIPPSAFLYLPRCPCLRFSSSLPPSLPRVSFNDSRPAAHQPPCCSSAPQLIPCPPARRFLTFGEQDILEYLTEFMCWKTSPHNLRRAIRFSPEAQSFRVVSEGEGGGGGGGSGWENDSCFPAVRGRGRCATYIQRSTRSDQRKYPACAQGCGSRGRRGGDQPFRLLLPRSHEGRGGRGKAELLQQAQRVRGDI